MDRIRKLTNVSQVQVPVLLANGETIYVPPRAVLENVEVDNYQNIARFVRAELDLTEVNTKTKKRYLRS